VNLGHKSLGRAEAIYATEKQSIIHNEVSKFSALPKMPILLVLSLLRDTLENFEVFAILLHTLAFHTISTMENVLATIAAGRIGISEWLGPPLSFAFLALQCLAARVGESGLFLSAITFVLGASS